MPIYTYACNACCAEIERRQSFSDSPLTTCESCGGALRKVLHASPVIFKGSGFYNTDYRKSSGNGASSDGDGTGKDTKAAETKTADSKPESSKTDGAATSTPTKSESKSEPAKSSSKA